MIQPIGTMPKAQPIGSKSEFKPSDSNQSLHRLVGSRDRRGYTWSISPEAAQWNDIWPGPHGQRPISDTSS